MSNKPTNGGAQVISIEEFRHKIEAPAVVTGSEYDVLFASADYGTTISARRMLNLLNGQSAPESLAIFIRDIHGPTKAVAHESDQSWAYAVERNIDDVEALMLDLEYGSEALEPKLRDPLDRFCTLSYIAHNAIQRDHRLLPVSEDDVPLYVGSERVHLSDDPERLALVNSWRAAGGLALMGITEHRPGLRQEMRGYLAKVLANRVEYVCDVQFMASISEQFTPADGVEIGDDILGVCTPFDEFGLRRAVKNLHNPQLD